MTPVEVAGTSGLHYRVTGSGAETLVLVNAMAQDVAIWKRLVAGLKGHYRIITWTPRGTFDDRLCSYYDQLDDMARVLNDAGVSRCHLLGWCTGAKQALHFAATHGPLVQSICLLSGAFKRVGGLEHLETDWERDMARFCTMVSQRPELAGHIAKTMAARMMGGEAELGMGGDDGPLARDLLAIPPRWVRELVTEVYRESTSILRYVAQLAEFWKHDIGFLLSDVAAPVLLLSGEYDEIASLDFASAIAAQLPCSRHFMIRGITHYASAERPELVANIVREFTADPGAFPMRESWAGDLRIMD